jgi:uncharacterized membrane protein YkgB
MTFLYDDTLRSGYEQACFFSFLVCFFYLIWFGLVWFFVALSHVMSCHVMSFFYVALSTELQERLRVEELREQNVTYIISIGWGVGIGMHRGVRVDTTWCLW